MARATRAMTTATMRIAHFVTRNVVANAIAHVIAVAIAFVSV